jgi:hypothetical protein
LKPVFVYNPYQKKAFTRISGLPSQIEYPCLV